jgi:uncharacterized membrane protein HdeD (DUF308 family)
VAAWIPGLEGTAVSWLVGALWVVGGIAFLGARFGILTHHDWWRTLAVLGAFASLVVLVPTSNLCTRSLPS